MVKVDEIEERLSELERIHVMLGDQAAAATHGVVFGHDGGGTVGGDRVAMRRLKGQVSEMKGLVDILLMEGVDSLITGSLTSGKEEVRTFIKITIKPLNTQTTCQLMREGGGTCVTLIKIHTHENTHTGCAVGSTWFNGLLVYCW